MISLTPFNFSIVYDVDVYTNEGTILPFHGLSVKELHDLIDDYLDIVQLINITMA